jgi:hypothetical protein
VSIGRDWAQSGVAELFTKIRNNGYHIMYLSARAIGQATITKDYLQSVKQVGPFKVLGGGGIGQFFYKYKRLGDWGKNVKWLGEGYVGVNFNLFHCVEVIVCNVP